MLPGTLLPIGEKIMKIYTTGLIAYETAKKLYVEHKAELAARFPDFFLREFEELCGTSYCISEVEIAEFFYTKHVKLSEDRPIQPDFLANLCIEKNTKNNYSNEKYYFDGQIYVREIKEGGLFGALWAACEDLQNLIAQAKRSTDAALTEGEQNTDIVPSEWMLTKNLKSAVGCEIHLEDIPIDQHVVEILEFLKESPYEVSSAGSYLIVLEESFKENLNSAKNRFYGVFKKPRWTQIGEITAAKDRVIIYGESRRFLTPPKRQRTDIADRKKH